MSNSKYYVPDGSYWPVIGSIGLFTMIVGFVNAIHGSSIGSMISIVGLGIIFFMLFGWFGKVIDESQSGLYNSKVDKSFRMGMSWFIFSEVMFFAAFFGALLYARVFSVPWLGGEEVIPLTNEYLWPNFKAVWPLFNTPAPNLTSGISVSVPKHPVDPWHIPLFNTLILLASGFTVTWAHHSLKNNKRNKLVLGMVLTVALGVAFLILHAYEYGVEYADGLKMTSGIYGTLFYMLTGIHGFHVVLGVIMLIVITMRCVRGHFNKDNHFGFEAVAWYWQFVDIVWLGLFVFVYWI